MTNAFENARAKQGMAALLAGGLKLLSDDQTIIFTKYVRLVLPLDGFVFWVKAAALAQGAQFNALGLNTSEFNSAKLVVGSPPTISIQGSLHYATQVRQEEAETEAVNTVVLSAMEPIQQFNNIEPSVLWVATVEGDIEQFDGPITFAFSSRSNYYETADEYHYVGVAVLPALKAQLIDGPDDLVSKSLWVSNCISLILPLSQYSPPYYDGFSSPLPLYPSYVVPDNVSPPYGVIHVFPESTETLQAAPLLDKTMTDWSLCKDHVRITLYGLNNEASRTWLNTFCQYSYDYNTFGLMTSPTIRDEKRIAVELGVIAQKKTIEVDISYTQGAARQQARQMLSKVFITKLPQPLYLEEQPPAP